MDKRVIAFLAATAFAASATAGGMGAEKAAMESGGQQFSQLDTDQDGRISKEEAQGQLKEHWTQADANNDGAVDQAEFSAFEAEQAGSQQPPKSESPQE